DTRWEHLFKTVLKDTLARPFAEASSLRPRKEVVRNSSALSSNTLMLDANEAISPICDRCRSTFNFALNGSRFALPVEGHVHEGERHESTHRMRDRRCVTRRERWPDDRERATGPATRFHCGRPPSDRRASVGEVANGRMVKRRRLPQRQIYRSDRVHEWGDEQNGGRLANGSPSRRQRRRRRRLSRMTRRFSSLHWRVPESGEGLNLRRLALATAAPEAPQSRFDRIGFEGGHA